MSDILALQLAVPPVIFPPPSRYNGLPTASIVIDGETITYVRRRFCPHPEVLAGQDCLCFDEFLIETMQRQAGRKDCVLDIKKSIVQRS